MVAEHARIDNLPVEWGQVEAPTVKRGELTERDAQLFLMGVDAGKLLERIEVLPHEPDALRGKVVRRAASTGGRTTAKLSPEERESARTQRDELMELGHTRQNASRIVAKKYNVSYKTIERLKKKSEK